MNKAFDGPAIASEEEKLQTLWDSQKREWNMTGLPNQFLLLQAEEAVESAKIKGKDLNLDILSRTLRVHKDFVFVAANRKGFKFLVHPNDRLYKEKNIMVLTEKSRYEMRIENLQDQVRVLKNRLAECEGEKLARDTEIIRKKKKSAKKEK